MTHPHDISACFQGLIPSVIATAGADGEPNVTYLSHTYLVDAQHVALSRQFFNKTTRNVEQNPVVTLIVYHPISFRAYRIRASFERSETSGNLFDTMSARIEVIASHTGMTGVFRLISADVYRILSLEEVEGFLAPAAPELESLPGPSVGGGPLTELRGLQVLSERIARATDQPSMLEGVLTALDELFGFSHAMILTVDSARADRLVVAASRGYSGSCLELDVEVGVGLIGTVAARRRLVRVAGVGAELRYGRAIRDAQRALDSDADTRPETPLPGLSDAQAQLAIPLLAGSQLVGVLAVESRDPLCFDEWDETFLQVVANQIATGIDRFRSVDAAADAGSGRKLCFTFYRNDDCVFVNGEYLVRNVPGRILWKLLTQAAREGRREFTNRELRLDPALGLPPIKDNLESRLALLRKRLEDRCSELRMIPIGRGRFALEIGCEFELTERDTA